MSYAIETKFLGPTNTRGARIKAALNGSSKTFAYAHELGSSENHIFAARQLAENFGYPDRFGLVSGHLQNGRMVHILVFD